MADIIHPIHPPLASSYRVIQRLPTPSLEGEDVGPPLGCKVPQGGSDHGVRTL